MSQTINQISSNVKVRFSLDASSKEAMKKFEASKFKKLVQKDVKTVSRNYSNCR